MAPRTRIHLDLEVDLDYIPGEFGTRDQALDAIQAILTREIPHYRPIVTVPK